jgi:hypothetical protein
VSFRHHLVRWEREYGPRGLVIVEVSGGQTASLEDSRRRFDRQAIARPVLWDRDNRTIDAYGVRDWPSAYLIGKDGRVFWEGNPARAGGRLEAVAEMRRLLEHHLGGTPAGEPPPRPGRPPRPPRPEAGQPGRHPARWRAARATVARAAPAAW